MLLGCLVGSQKRLVEFGVLDPNDELEFPYLCALGRWQTVVDPSADRTQSVQREANVVGRASTVEQEARGHGVEVGKPTDGVGLPSRDRVTCRLHASKKSSEVTPRVAYVDLERRRG